VLTRNELGADHPHDPGTHPLPEQRGCILPGEVSGQRFDEFPRHLGEGVEGFHSKRLKPVPVSFFFVVVVDCNFYCKSCICRRAVPFPAAARVEAAATLQMDGVAGWVTTRSMHRCWTPPCTSFFLPTLLLLPPASKKGWKMQAVGGIRDLHRRARVPFRIALEPYCRRTWRRRELRCAGRECILMGSGR